MAEKDSKKPDAGAPKGQHGEKGWGKGDAAKAPTSAAPKPKGGDPRKKDVAQVILGRDGKEIRGIVRMAGRDIKGQWTVKRAITTVKGIGLNLGSVITGVALSQIGADDKTMIGELNEQQMQKLERVLSRPEEFGVPEYMLNRQKEFVSGTSRHAIGADLDYAIRQDIDREKDAYTWRGYRHAYGQKVRGQHTRSTGRTGMTVGVLRKAVLAKAGAAAAAATGAAAQAAGGAPAAGAKKEEKAPSGAAKAPAGAAPAAKAAPAGKPPAGDKK